MEIIHTKDNIGEIIISITPEKQDNHYGAEAIRAILVYAYQNLNLAEIELYVYVTNLKVIHCY